MANNNAFWREVIDYLPKLMLVFRVDENENAQLIFCNKKIRNQLGYSPKEYVLASEQEGGVQEELEALVDEIARRSHDVERIAPRPCTLTDKEGRKRQYKVDYRLFQTKGGGSHLINVELTPKRQKEETASFSSTKPDKKKDSVNTKELFVCKSDIMQSVWDTIQHVCAQTERHLLLRGERGTGKETLAKRALSCFNEDDIKPLTWRFDEEGAGPDTDDWKQAREQQAPLALVLIHITGMSESEQEALLDLLRQRGQEDRVTRLIATSRHSLEEKVEEGNFQASLYYHIGFQSVLIPPLRHRKDDIREAARQYVEKAADALQLKVGSLEEEELQKLEEQQWEGNFPALFDVLRRSLLEADDDQFEVRLKEKNKFQLFPEQQITEDEVLGFDEMNRRYLERILELTDGKIYGDDGAAALLDLKPTTLQSKLKRLGIK